MEYLTLKEVQNIELNILLKFDSYCKKHNLYYTLIAGTLLGAIRHKGFIPWDDDIDVAMPRADYERFITLCASEPVSDDLTLLHHMNSEYYYPFAKLCNVNTIAKMSDNCSQHGIWLDIFPVDGLPDTLSEQKKLFWKIKIGRNAIIAMTTDFSNRDEVNKQFAKKVFNAYATVVGKEKILERQEVISKSYDGTKTKYVAPVVWCAGGTSEVMENAEFMKKVSVQFEGYEFPAPSCWHSWLTNRYGDYMKLPAEKDRQQHHLQAWYK
jgi:lipopolysaccharide cholinephosphotransferase